MDSEMKRVRDDAVTIIAFQLDERKMRTKHHLVS
jgi:hypothetical protein